MKIKFGAIITDGRGKIGGHVASKNRSGAYMRTKVTPSNPNTASQSQARSLLASLSQGWRTLTNEQRLAWNGAVSDWSKTDIFGDIKNPSGLNLYIKINSNLSNVGLTDVSVPPAKKEVPSALVTGATFSIATGDLVVALSDTTADGTLAYVRATPSLSKGVSFVKSELRVIGTEEVVADGFTLGSAYVDKFGSVLAGSNVKGAIQFVLTSGQKTVNQQFDIKIVA